MDSSSAKKIYLIKNLTRDEMVPCAYTDRERTIEHAKRLTALGEEDVFGIIGWDEVAGRGKGVALVYRNTVFVPTSQQEELNGLLARIARLESSLDDCQLTADAQIGDLEAANAKLRERVAELEAESVTNDALAVELQGAAAALDELEKLMWDGDYEEE